MSDTGIEWRVCVGDSETSARLEQAGSDAPVFVCAHGAGGHMGDRGMVAVAGALRAAGFAVVRFNFLYRERGSGRPDPMPLLQECITAVVDHTRSALGRRTLVIGGRSMGGRAASMLAANAFPAEGLLLLAYPLHPAGQQEKMRDAHLPTIAMPTLCINGTRDALCRQDLMAKVLPRLKPTFTMHWLEGADHSFHVLKSSGRTDADVVEEVRRAARDWVGTIPPSLARQ